MTVKHDPVIVIIKSQSSIFLATFHSQKFLSPAHAIKNYRTHTSPVCGYCTVLTNSHIIGERAKRARHYQGCTNSSLCGIYIYIYIYICMEVRMPY